MTDWLDANQVQTVTLEEGCGYQVRAGQISRAKFAMDDRGEITFEPGMPLTVDR